MIFSFLRRRGYTLYYPGCMTAFALPELFSLYRTILDKLGMDYLLMPELRCCGSPVRNAGYERKTRELARKNFEMLRQKRVTKIITNCPACYKTFMQDYKEMLPTWDIETEHIVSTILRALEKKPKLLRDSANELVTYHDPCHLGRYAQVYEEPRKLLEILGYRLVEMSHTRDEALCCGAGAGVKANFPDIANRSAWLRVKEAKLTGASKLVTACPLCYAHLRENSRGLEVVELAHVIARALGIPRPEDKIHDVSKQEVKWD